MVPEATGHSCWRGRYSPAVATDSQIRLLLVGGVAQVSQLVRGLLQHQKQLRLLGTVAEGGPFVLAQPNARASREISGTVQRLMPPTPQSTAQAASPPVLATSAT